MRIGFKKENRERERNALGLKENEKLILSFGGSLGAEEMNKACIEMMAKYIEKDDKLFHIHATGKRNYEVCKEKFDSLLKNPSERITLKKYIDNMPELMGASDVVISRAGAMSISEIALMGKASILIPSPNVTNNHQYKNAKMLADKNATVLLEEKDLNAESLFLSIKSILENEKKRKELEENVCEFAVNDANKRVYEELLKLDFGVKHGEKFRGLKIPTFEEILQKFGGRVIMNIHVKIWDCNFKNPMIEEIVDIIRKYDCEKYIYFMTTNDEIIKRVMEYAPDLRVCVGWDGNKEPLSMVKRAIALGAHKVQLFKPYFNRESVDLAHANGILCNVFWSDDPEEARRYREMGIDTILTNDYLAIKNALN